MITGPVTTDAAIGQHLNDIAVALAGYGVGCQVTYPAGTPVLTTGPPAGPNAVTVAIDPDMHAAPGLRLDCICVWTPAQGTSHLGWSAFWDPRYGQWRAAEDDPASVLYVETSDADAVMTYITNHS
ncbi:MAG: hypothetical protein ABSB59_03625 [Streptosporangiaceae bacterium]|jgi:hypothetical protein